MKRGLLMVVILAAGFAGGAAYMRWQGGRAAAPAGKGERKILYWHDPMHPAYKSDKPGIAPDCGMKLEPVYADGGPADSGAERTVLFYRDPHAPGYRSGNPGLNPETGNELVPVYTDDAASAIPGAVEVTPEKQQLIGVRYGEVEVTPGAQSLRAVGKVTYDETRLHHVHSRTEGFIERVFVDFTGDQVKQGQPLLTLYSPELLASQQEYLLALKARDILQGSTVRGVASGNNSLVEAARRRLELWSLSEDQIDELEQTGRPKANVTLYADASGFVLTRNAFAHQKVTPETELYTIADLSRVWVLASVFEYEAPQVRVGQSAVVTAAYAGSRRIPARVSYIQPQIDAATRTMQVRLELPNPGLALKPEMFVDVELQTPASQRLTVPFEAVLDSGLKKTVYVAAGQGWFEPREVQTGQRSGDRIEVLSGLRVGERIVTSGVFLINSESQLKAAAAGMGAPAGHQHEAQQPANQPNAAERPADPHGAHQHD